MENVSQCSPACISKFQIIHVRGQKDDWKSLVAVWSKQVPQPLELFARGIRYLVTYYLEGSLACLSRLKSTYLGLAPAKESIVRSFLRMYLVLLRETFTRKCELLDDKHQEPNSARSQIHQGIEGTLVLSLVWTVGMYVLEEER